MKKSIFALMMCLMATASIFASNDLIIDHNSKTIVIQANFVTVAPILETLNDAVSIWNNRTNSYFYEIDHDGVKQQYTVVFKLVVNAGSENDIAQNIVTVLPDNSPFFKKRPDCTRADEGAMCKPICVSDGESIGISESFKANKYVLAYEIGHNLGFSKIKGQRTSVIGEKELLSLNVVESLSKLSNLSFNKSKTLRKVTEIGAYNKDLVVLNTTKTGVDKL